MTIITKPFGEKKVTENVSAPLVLPTASDESVKGVGSVEKGELIILKQQRMKRSAVSLLLLLTALLVTCMGIISGIILYRQYANSRMQRMRFHGFCGIPYDATGIDNKEMLYMNEKWRNEENKQTDDILGPLLASMENEIQNLLKDDVDNNNDFFREEFELDLTDESYSKIDVPNFREGRRGRFLHDFKFNQSAIIDNDYNNCFIMDLDRETVLPPRSMYDLITKMWRGYYNIDTNVIRQNMRVVTPAITNYDDISQKIVSECDKMKIYKLEKLVSGVYKRSIDLHESEKFAEFSGKNIVMYNIHGLENDITSE